jgi:hypothetical protein
MQVSGSGIQVRNSKFLNFTSYGTYASGTNQTIYNCEATGGTSAAVAGFGAANTGQVVFQCNVHDNACPGIIFSTATATGLAAFNLITNNTGASSDGITCTSRTTILNNTIYGSGRHGMNNTATATGINCWWKNNILAKNGASGTGYGAVGSGVASGPADEQWDGNAYWNNATGTRHFMDDIGGTNAINGIYPYTNVLDVVISGTGTTNDPFTADATGDFTLNNTAGAGALLRGTATPGGLPVISQVGYMDFGVLQTQCVSGTGSFSFTFG